MLEQTEVPEITSTSTPKVHVVFNPLGQQIMDGEMLENLIDGLVSELDKFGYRLCFPILAGTNGVTHCLALLCKVSDSRLKVVMKRNKMDIGHSATHVLLFHAYHSEREWLKAANGITNLFPEQPNAKEGVVR